jgi:hypothetical protein
MVEDKAKVGKKNEKREKDELLSGMKAICDYINRTEPTVLSYIKSQSFPAKKVGGIWECSKGDVDAWRGVYFAR